MEDAMASRVLVIGGSPAAASPETVRRAALGCDAVVAVDRGLDAALAAGVPCDLFCGDGDSVGDAAARALAASEAAARADDDGEPAFRVERYNPHKDATDLELALDAVAERWPGAVVRATCLTGGAPDHFLAVMGRLARWAASAGCGMEGPRVDAERPAVELVEDGFEGRILRAGQRWRIRGVRDQRFSFVPLSSEAVVSEAGMRWKLDHKRVGLLGDLGISNVIDEPDACFTCHEGVAVAYLFDGYFAGA